MYARLRLSGDINKVSNPYRFADILNQAVPLSEVFGAVQLRDRLIIASFTPEELEIVISGDQNIDVDYWKRFTEYQGLSTGEDGKQPDSPVIIWFWEYVDSLTQAQLKQLLQFTSGASRTPAGGFAYLRGDNGLQVVRFL